MRTTLQGLLCFAVVSALGLPAVAQDPAAVLEFTYTPAIRPQIAIWIEDEAGNLKATVGILCGMVVFVASILLGWMTGVSLGTLIVRSATAGLLMGILAYIVTILGLMVLGENQAVESDPGKDPPEGTEKPAVEETEKSRVAPARATTDAEPVMATGPPGGAATPARAGPPAGAGPPGEVGPPQAGGAPATQAGRETVNA